MPHKDKDIGYLIKVLSEKFAGSAASADVFAEAMSSLVRESKGSLKSEFVIEEEP